MQGVETVREEALSRNRLYRPPVTLRKREEGNPMSDQRIVEANE